MIENLKVNLHILENCNYQCKHCFAHFGSKRVLKLEDWIKENAKYFSTIGFSIDSFHEDTLLNIGRYTNNRDYLGKERFEGLVRSIKKHNPKCKIKVNTVVTKLNMRDNICDTIDSLGIDRWKILKMQKFVNSRFNNSSLEITDEEYKEYIDKVLQYATNTDVIIEDTLKSAYIMIDARGYLVDDSKNDNYIKIGNCLRENFKDCLEKLDLNEELYNKRYR